MGTNNEPTWRGAAGAKRAAAKPDWKGEDPQAAPGRGKRRAKLFVLALGGAGAVAGIVWLILLLMAGKRPGLIAVAADPEYDPAKAVARLDVPYDPYGWLSGVRLLDWADKVARDDNTPKALGEKPYWLDDLDTWAEQVGRDANIDPVVIYVGVPGGVNRAGDPFLYAGRDTDPKDGLPEDDGRAVLLRTVLEKLDEHAARKRKLLVLDTGRALPDPLLGEVASDFAWAVKKKLGPTIAGNPTLAVVLSADEGQRAWDSPDLGMTALSYHLLKALSAGAGRENMESYRADELYEAVRREVEQWSKNNRPTAQVPVLIPAKDDWAADEPRKARYGERLFYKPKSAGPPLAEVAPPAPMPPPDVRIEGEMAVTMANRQPAPAVYTPASWRRYRELLLRFERAAMAGDAKGAAALKNALAATRKDIERGTDIKPESTAYVLPLVASLGQPTPQMANWAYDVPKAHNLLAGEQRARGALRGEGRVPVELHLPVMLQHYVKTVLKVESDPTVEATWKAATTTRLLAERAALGVPAGTDGRAYAAGLPYSERVWPAVRDDVRKADELRREGEDRVHGPADQIEPAKDLFKKADGLYNAALAEAERRQGALRLRDTVLADLPFLTRWIVEADDKSKALDPAKANELLFELWKYSLQLADRTDPTFTADAAATKAVTDRYDALLAHVADSARLPQADAQTSWQSIEYLLQLPPPLLSPARREELVRKARDISHKFNGAQAEVAGQPQAVDTKTLRRMRAAAASLGGGWAAWADKRGDLERAAAVGEKDPDLHAKAAAFAADAAAHRGKQADFKNYPAGKAPEWAQAELFSRLAAPFAPVVGFEPASVNAQALWKDLLEAQAFRVALDHWYNEAGQPYFPKVVKALLDDADDIERKLPDARRGKTTEAATAARLARVKGLQLTTPDGGDVRWTTETDRTFRYSLSPTPYQTADNNGPEVAVPGHAVLLWHVTEPGLLTLTARPRELVDLGEKAAGRAVAVKAGPKIDDAAQETRTAAVRAGGYFRGQRNELTRDTTVRINRRPDLVVADVRPERAGVIAVRADREFDPGAVSILLDFSGSMGDAWKKEKKASKKDEVIAILQELLSDLPRGTDLTVRVFHDNPGFEDKKSTLVFPGTFGTNNFRDVLTTPNGILDKLRAIPAKGATPLVATMKDALADIRPGYQGVKTLIVLTDGADTTRQPDVFTAAELKDGVVTAEAMKGKPQRERLLDKVRADVEKVRQDDVSVHMVVFGAGAEEERLGVEMFQKVEEWETPGRVYRAEDAAALKRELETALRPKPRLLLDNGTAVPSGVDRGTYVPRNGLPINRSDQAAGELRWWGFLPTDERYKLKYFRSEQPLLFAAGDAVCVRLKKGELGRVTFHRELYYRDVADLSAQPGRTDDTNPDWFLAAPEFAKRNSNWNYLTTTVALEEKNGTTVGPGGDLRQPRPAVVWWELVRVADGREERFPGTVTVHNLDGHHAPSWRIVGNTGAAAVGPHYRVRGWVANELKPVGTARVPAAELATGAAQPVGDGVTVRATLETLPFFTDGSVNERLPADARGPRRCLVVRVDDPHGRLLQVQVPELGKVQVKEHRYFYDKEADKLPPRVAGCTAVFGPLSDDALARLTDLRLSVGSVTAAIGPPGKPPLQLDLKNPTNTERDLSPIEPLTESRR